MHARSENLHDGARSAPEICDIFMNRRANSSYFNEAKDLGIPTATSTVPVHSSRWPRRAAAAVLSSQHAKKDQI